MNYHWVVGKDDIWDTFDKALLNRLLVPSFKRRNATNPSCVYLKY